MVAWLHELLEHTSISEEALLAEGLSLDELRALRLLTRDKDSRSNAIYRAHVELIARARGAGASVARSVKRADLADRARHPQIGADGWSPPYEAALVILRRLGFHPLCARERDRPVTRVDERDKPEPARTEPESRGERLGFALRSLAADLVDERRKVAELRREVAELRSRLGRNNAAPRPQGK